MAIIGAPDSLKCKLLSGTFREATLRWYMGLPRATINNYQELVRKLVHQFNASLHQKMSITIMFNICQGPLESLRDNLTRFNKAIIKVIPLNKDMFFRAFQNGLKKGHFNESLAQNPTLMLAKVVPKTNCYIKGKERNAKKKTRDSKEPISGERSHSSNMNNYPSPVKEKSTFKRVGKMMESFTPLNTRR